MTCPHCIRLGRVCSLYCYVKWCAGLLLGWIIWGWGPTIHDEPVQHSTPTQENPNGH